ncbi:hypothetical protein CPC08DRAFT_646734, partial [Agrocybe pediades]
MGYQSPSEEDVFDYGLYLLDVILGESGHSLANFPSMPRPQRDWAIVTMNPLIAEELNYDRESLQADLEERLRNLNPDQRHAYTRITQAIEDQQPKVFFLNGPGGAGKTYVYNTVCARVRSQGNVVLCVSSSGISALLIRGGRTAHSMFKIPVDTLSETSVCNIPKNSLRADLMRAAKAII